MRCYYHQNIEAVGTCKNCGRGVCVDCAQDVGNGLACRGRCEEEVRVLNRVLERNKTAFERTGGAYARTAAFYAVIGGVFLVGGLANWRGFGPLLIPAGLIFLFSAYMNYSTGKRYRKD